MLPNSANTSVAIIHAHLFIDSPGKGEKTLIVKENGDKIIMVFESQTDINNTIDSLLEAKTVLEKLKK